MKRRPLLLATALIALLLAIAWFLLPAGPRPGPSAGPGKPPAAAGSGAGPNAGSAAVPAVPSTDEPSHLADELNAPSGDIHADLRLLDEIFRQYRSSTHGANPVGDNLDLTAVLTGRNRLGFAFIPPHHPAINGRGELCDRWGTPFFFHQLSGIQMEIHSAGPDRQLWTKDDEVLTPGLRPPPL